MKTMKCCTYCSCRVFAEFCGSSLSNCSLFKLYNNSRL